MMPNTTGHFDTPAWKSSINFYCMEQIALIFCQISSEESQSREFWVNFPFKPFIYLFFYYFKLFVAHTKIPTPRLSNSWQCKLTQPPLYSYKTLFQLENVSGCKRGYFHLQDEPRPLTQSPRLAAVVLSFSFSPSKNTPLFISAITTQTDPSKPQLSSRIASFHKQPN